MISPASVFLERSSALRTDSAASCVGMVPYVNYSSASAPAVPAAPDNDSNDTAADVRAASAAAAGNRTCDPDAALNCSDPRVLAAVKMFNARVFFRKSIVFLSYETPVPGPKPGQCNVAWRSLAYVGVSFVLAVVRTVRRLTFPRTKKKRRVGKNIFLLKSLDDLFQKGREAIDYPALQDLMQKTGFDMDDVVRKYIRYTLNEKQFNPDVVVDLIHLRKASMLEDVEDAEILNEISRRIVGEKGKVVIRRGFLINLGFAR